MKTIIAGSRNYTNYNTLKHFIEEIHIEDGLYITEVISGNAIGVDKLGEKWAVENGIPCTIFPAEWDIFGKAAGPIRNKKMAEYGECLIALIKDESKGTANMIKQAEEHGLTVYVLPVK